MRSKWVKRIVSVGVITIFLAGSLYALPKAPGSNQDGTPTVNWYFVERSTALLKELQGVAGKLNRDAETLGSFARSPGLSWQSHAHYLNNARDHINKAGSLLTELQSMRHGVALWQKQAIDRITPVAAETAAHTEAAIKHLRENQGRHFVPEYTDRLTMIKDRAAEMNQTVDNFLDYGETQRKLLHLQRTLEVGSS
ncbi:MAG: hypothetical protein WBC04_07095 [Candidatus Acidiferrales bacterium]